MTKDEYFKLCIALVQEQLYTWVIASSVVMVVDAPKVWLTMRYSILKVGSVYRPYALTSRLHNNDAMLGVKTCRAARTCCAGRALALSRCAGPGRPGGMACRGWPAGCMLGDGARDSASFDPQHAGAPFCDVICIRSIGDGYCMNCKLDSALFTIWS